MTEIIPFKIFDQVSFIDGQDLLFQEILLNFHEWRKRRYIFQLVEIRFAYCQTPWDGGY